MKTLYIYFLLSALTACTTDTEEDDTETGFSDDTGTSDLSPFESCLDAAGLPLTCDTANTVEWLLAGEDISCIAMGDYDAAGRFRFDLNTTQDGNPLIETFSLEPRYGSAPEQGAAVIFSAPEPTLLTPEQPLDPNLAWTMQLVPSAMTTAIGGFELANPGENTLVFDTPIVLEDLMAGADISGTFSFRAGVYTTSDGEITDETAEGIGCFNVPSELTILSQ